MRELILREKVDWILTGTGSAISLAACAVAQEFKQPTFIMGGGTEKVTVEEWSPYIFRYRPTSGAEARAAAKIVAEHVIKDIKNPKIYWISWDYEYGWSLYRPFMAKIKELRPDVQIVGEAWPRIGETYYGPNIIHMMSVRPDVVVNAIWGGGAVAFLKQGTSTGLWDMTTLMSVAEFAGFEYRKTIGHEIPEETWGSAYDDPGWPNNEGHKKYYDLYYSFTGKSRDEPPATFVYPTYNMVRFINEGMKKAGTSDPMTVLKAMEGVELDTFQGRIKIRDFDHQVTSGYVWGPMIKKGDLPYLIMDPKRLSYVPIEDDLYTKEEWASRRKEAGK
jgi:branched-chain amino acid transport system substrate-binding protein